MKRILITGANKGIGLATVAKLLDSYDETFLLLGSRDSKKGQEALNSLVDSQPEWKDRLDFIQTQHGVPNTGIVYNSVKRAWGPSKFCCYFLCCRIN